MYRDRNDRNNNFKNYERNRNPGNRDRRTRGKDTVDIEQIKESKRERPKIPNVEAIERSKQNNKIVESLIFSSPSGRYFSLQGNLSMYFTLMPTKPLVDCKHIRLLETVEVKEDAINDRKNITYVRGCFFDKKEGEMPNICNISNDKINTGNCIGNKFQGASIEFLIVTDGYCEIDDEGREFKVMFINKNTTFTKEVFIPHKDLLKNGSLFNLYNNMKAGKIKERTVPKPGNTLFHTLFSKDVEVEVEIETLRATGADIVRGIVKGYEFTPGGHPSLIVHLKEGEVEKIRILPLYTVGLLIVRKYKCNDILSKRTIELTLKGHIVIPNKDKDNNNQIFDYCKSSVSGGVQKIKLDGTVVPPLDNLDKHDIELKNMIRN